MTQTLQRAAEAIEKSLANARLSATGQSFNWPEAKAAAREILGGEEVRGLVEAMNTMASVLIYEEPKLVLQASKALAKLQKLIDSVKG